MGLVVLTAVAPLQVLSVVLHYSFNYEGTASEVLLYDVQEVPPLLPPQPPPLPPPLSLSPAHKMLLTAALRSMTAQLLWTFSIYLEAVAILPQLFLLQRTGAADTLTADYVFCLVPEQKRPVVNASDHHAGCIRAARASPAAVGLSTQRPAGRSLAAPDTLMLCRAPTGSSTFSTGSGGRRTRLGTRCDSAFHLFSLPELFLLPMFSAACMAASGRYFALKSLAVSTRSAMRAVLTPWPPWGCHRTGLSGCPGSSKPCSTLTSSTIT